MKPKINEIKNCKKQLQYLINTCFKTRDSLNGILADIELELISENEIDEKLSLLGFNLRTLTENI